MRLAFCNATRRWGGVKTWTIEFAGALQDRGHEITVYGRDPAFVERAGLQGLDARLVDFSFDYNPLVVAGFYRDFRRRGIEAVLVNVSKDLRTAGAAARLAGIPLVQRVGLPRDMENTASTRLSHFLLQPHYLCPCRYIRDGLLRALPFLEETDTSVVYSAKVPLSEPPKGAEVPRRILSSSQVNANKGHAELARTLAALMREGIAFHWDIAGTGNRLEDLRALCSSLGLEDRVTFHGFTQDLPALLRACDVFVLSSYTEGLPNTLLEAMAHGLVPVARNVGGVQECWPSGLESLLVPYEGWERDAEWNENGSAMPFLAPLRRVLLAADDDLIRWKGEAWTHMTDNFSLSAQAEKLEALFVTLCSKAARANN